MPLIKHLKEVDKVHGDLLHVLLAELVQVEVVAYCGNFQAAALCLSEVDLHLMELAGEDIEYYLSCARAKACRFIT